MSGVQNILFIMVDQMRADCLGCEGHPTVRTPNLDWLASRSVRFDHAYVQTAVCGPSRMCYLTGRYTHAHRSYWNGIPLPADEVTLPEYTRSLGLRSALCGKVHHTPDERGPAERIRRHGGFEPWELQDSTGEGWLRHLRSRGYSFPSGQPGVDVFTVRRPDGVRVNGWRFEAAPYPTVIADEDSDTAYLTQRAMDFIDNAGGDPWMLHLSYFKPHWPLVAPDPYHRMYPLDAVPAPVRTPSELAEHPLLGPFRTERRSVPLDEERTWRQLRATYYGLITQLDDYLGRLWDFLRQRGLFDNTMIVFTSDHGEYLGDHWLFEKEMFYEQATRVPLMVFDPDQRADAARGRVVNEFVESIDIAPTIIDALGGTIPTRIQGESLLPWLRGDGPAVWRDAAHGDWDFRGYKAGVELGLDSTQCRAWMIRTEDVKYIYFNGLPDLLFDLRSDPQELANVANDPDYRELRVSCLERLLRWRQSYEDSALGPEPQDKRARAGVKVPDAVEVG